jgi:hypothetical protein
MLLALGAQALWAAFTNSATWDESIHVTKGLSALRTGDFRMNKAEPPLMDMLSAVAAIAGGAPSLPLDSPEWRAPGTRSGSTTSAGRRT